MRRDRDMRDFSTHDEWTSADQRALETAKTKLYPIEVSAAHLENGWRVFEVAQYRIDSLGALGLFGPSGLVAFFAPGSWQSIEQLEYEEDEDAA